MKALSVIGSSVACGLAVTCAAAMPLAAFEISEPLAGGNENPPVISDGTGQFLALVGPESIDFRLHYDVSDVTQAHIHIANPGNNGPIVVFLCSNADNTPIGATSRLCPTAPAVVEGVIVPADVLEVVDDATTVIEAQDLDGLIRLIEQGATYVNVHTTDHPPGEIRGQINPRQR